MLPSFANRVKISEAIREIAGLVVLDGTTLVAHDFLQGYDVGADLREHSSDAFDANPAIKSPALVNVVRGNAESIHGYT